MTERDWNEHYLLGELPWDTDEPDPNLVEFLRTHDLARGRALDVGCGTGTHAVWLAQQGYDVLGVDVSEKAVEKALARAARAGVAADFTMRDFLVDGAEGGPFEFVFDRGCFHCFDEPAQRLAFAARVAACLAPDGVWLSLIGSTEGPARETGPPRRSARDIAEAIEPALEIVELRATEFDLDLDLPVRPRAWLCVARSRSVPAQPSTA